MSDQIYDYDPIASNGSRDNRPVFIDHSEEHRRLNLKDPLTDETLKREAWSLETKLSSHPGKPGHEKRLEQAERKLEEAEAAKLHLEGELNEAQADATLAAEMIRKIKDHEAQALVAIQHAKRDLREAGNRVANAKQHLRNVEQHGPHHYSEFLSLQEQLESIKTELKERGYTGTSEDYANR